MILLIKTSIAVKGASLERERIYLDGVINFPNNLRIFKFKFHTPKLTNKKNINSWILKYYEQSTTHAGQCLNSVGLCFSSLTFGLACPTCIISMSHMSISNMYPILHMLIFQNLVYYRYLYSRTSISIYKLGKKIYRWKHGSIHLRNFKFHEFMPIATLITGCCLIFHLKYSELGSK